MVRLDIHCKVLKVLAGGLVLAIGLLISGAFAALNSPAEAGGVDPELGGPVAVPQDADRFGTTPKRGAPGSRITVRGRSFRPFSPVESIKIGGLETLGGRTVNTDGNGDFVANDLLTPSLDPGTYSLIVEVGSGNSLVSSATTFEITAPGTPAGEATPVALALASLVDADNLERVFHFDNTRKNWTFYDPRPEFAGANTIVELVSGKVYWIKVKSSQAAALNGRERDLTCIDQGSAGENCWNQAVW